MRVAVTGGTGYVGAQSVAALRRAGHQVRLLVHPADANRPLSSYGVDATGVEVVEGDVADPTAVAELLDGAEGLLHMAGIVAVDNRREADMWRVNVDATRALVTAAVERGVDPTVHVSSYVALFPSPTGVIGPDTQPAVGRSAYGRTKSAADRFMRGLQNDGAPVVVVYPPGIVGPALGDRPGIAAEGWAPLLRHRTTVTVRGIMPMIDVRDVADLFAAVMRPGDGPRRLPCGGQVLTFDEVLDVLEQATGRTFRRLRIGPRTFRGMGRAFDAAARVLPLPPSFSYEAAWLLTCGQLVDDSAALAVLGRPWRDVRAGLIEAVESVSSAATPTATPVAKRDR
jgi:UDP-glucose 4-epimerase